MIESFPMKSAIVGCIFNLLRKIEPSLNFFQPTPGRRQADALSSVATTSQHEGCDPQPPES